MAYSNKEWLNQYKNTNLNINEINSKMISTIEGMEKENVNHSYLIYIYLL